MKRLPTVDFSKNGWRQFARMNRTLGARFLKGFILRRELAEYIAAHEQSGVRLDTICQEVRYDDGVYLLMKKCRGVWYITEIWTTEAPAAFEPVFVWRQINCGCRIVVRQALACWRGLIELPTGSRLPATER